MVVNVEQVLSANKSTWENEIRVVELVDYLILKKKSLDELFQEKQELSIPYQEVKKELLKEFAMTITKLAGLLHEICVSKDIKNMSLYTDVSKSSLLNFSIQQLLTKANSVIDYAHEMQEDLLTFAHGESLLQSAERQFNEFDQMGLLPYDRRNRLKEVNTEIKEVISDIKQLLVNRLDRVIGYFEEIDNMFVTSYSYARVMNKTTSRKSQSEAKGDVESENNSVVDIPTDSEEVENNDSGRYDDHDEVA